MFKWNGICKSLVAAALGGLPGALMIAFCKSSRRCCGRGDRRICRADARDTWSISIPHMEALCGDDAQEKSSDIR